MCSRRQRVVAEDIELERLPNRFREPRGWRQTEDYPHTNEMRLREALQNPRGVELTRELVLIYKMFDAVK